MPRYESRVVVANAAGAIGAATVTALLAQGSQVVAVDADAVALRGLAVAGAQTLQADLSTAAGRAVLAEHAGPLTALVIADLPSISAPLNKVDDQHWSEVFDTHARTVFYLCRDFCPKLAPGGSVVLVTSVAGKTGRNPEVTVYSAGEAALLSLTRSFANAYGQSGVRVNAICTGIIDTPANTRYLNEVAAARGIGVGSLSASRLATVPLARSGTPSECAEAICYLLSPAASFITGQAVNVTGGFCNH